MAINFGLGTTAIIFAVTSIMMYYLARCIRIFVLISKFHGPPALPIVGNLHKFRNDPREHFLYINGVLDEYRERSGGIVRWWLGPRPSLTIYGAKHVEALLNSSRNTKKSFAYFFTKPWLGLGLLLSYGKKWFQRRKMLTPTFHFSILQNFVGVFNEQSNILAEKLDAVKDQHGPVNILPLVTHCTLDIICDTAMGKHTNAQGEGDSEYVRAVKGMAALAVFRGKHPHLWMDEIFSRTEAGSRQKKYLEVLHGFTKSMIQQRLREPNKHADIHSSDDGAIAGKRKRVAFLDLLIQMHREDPSFTLADIQEEVDTFMFEGHDTTAAAISWSLYLLGLHPDVQERLHEEVVSVLGDTDRHVTTDDLQKLTYLTCVVKETLRVLPSVPVIGRTLDSDIILDGKLVPKETSIILGIYALHRDPGQFPDPDKFDPDRFLADNTFKRHPFAYVPFSAGPRNCIGQKFAMMEIKVTLANLLRRFSFRSMQTEEEVKPAGQLILSPAESQILMKVSKRE
ncbi:cytochrome P450 4V2-like [Diadema antillarum]|uniref:cytochrome P450 4V2-like n=1 Tax=Diadema antillarum TaxID=105358 RepID=UPI003A83A92A